MFTSRAEYRILLRQDNADDRLTEKGRALGLVTDEAYDRYETKVALRSKLCDTLANKLLKLGPLNEILAKVGSTPSAESVKATQALARPQLHLTDLMPLLPEVNRLFAENADLRDEVMESAEIEIKYGGYIQKEKQQAERILRHNNIPLRGKIDYASVTSLSYEAREKLIRIDPATIDQAMRIPGVSPADISILMILLGR